MVFWPQPHASEGARLGLEPGAVQVPEPAPLSDNAPLLWAQGGLSLYGEQGPEEGHCSYSAPQSAPTARSSAPTG